MRIRSEIIDVIVAAHRAEVEREASKSFVSADAKAYEHVIRSALLGKLASLRADEKVRTCEDFGHLGIACCDSCHMGYPHYELDLIELERGGCAWICCALGRALNPAHHQQLLNSPIYQNIGKFLGGESDSQKEHN